jgi:hypothetical protein
MAYANGRELVDDVIFRAGESVAQSDWLAKALDYLNRSYRTLCAGSSEYLPEYVDDWWWLRGSGVLTLEPVRTVGTVTVVQNSATVTFSAAPPASMAGWKLRVASHPEIFTIASHTAASATATLDSVYTGANATGLYSLMRVTYTLSSAVQSLISPMIGFRGNPRIAGVTPEAMDGLFPLSELQSGVPEAFALEDTLTVRFSHGGLTTGQSMRVEYRYRKTVTDLAYDVASIPLVPAEYRATLADMALSYVWLDKNDDRSNATALGARTGLAAMFKENRRKLVKMGTDSIGHIYPRPGMRRAPGPLRTASGLIIG